jgi:GNAT superfamily N-acetyltransferase
MDWLITDPIPQHFPDLRRIYQQGRQMAFPWADPTTFERLDFDQATQDERLLVATYQQIPIGFIAWWPPDNFIHSLFIDPLFMGKGVGKSLLHACLNEVGRPATLKCKSANQNALAFYYSQGWRPIQEVEATPDSYLLLAFNG